MKDMPLYKTIYEDLRQKIENGTYSENAALPSERVLCQMYHVSRSTMRFRSGRAIPQQLHC